MLYALYLVYLDMITRATFFYTADISADRGHSAAGQQFIVFSRETVPSLDTGVYSWL